MNELRLTHPGGFPLTQDTMNFMQEAYRLFNSLGALAGDLAILKGCAVSSGTVSNGVVYINGEILPFVGGTLGGNVIVVSQETPKTFEDGVDRNVEIVRFAKFGTGATMYAWNDFKQAGSLIEKEAKIQNLTTRLDNLESQLNATVPVGLVAVWDKPAIAIPNGWVEHTPLRGRYPKGYNPVGLGVIQALGSTGGSALLQNIATTGTADFTDYDNAFVKPASSDGENCEVIIRNKGIEPPFRIVRFIRFVGFGASLTSSTSSGAGGTV